MKLANASYDALGRMTSWSDTGSNGPPASVTWSYDAAGNIREQHASYQLLDQNGSPSGPQQSDDEWFTYDAMNRVAIAGGRLSSGQVVRGSGLAYLYDADGELVQSLRSATIVTLGVQWAPDTSQGYDGGDFVDARISYPGEEEEDYTYDLGGAVSSVQVLETGWGTNFATQSVTVSDQRDLNGGHSVFSHDQLGRLVDQTDYVPSQTSTVVPDVGYSDHRNYDEEGRVTTETSTTLKRSTGGVGSSVWQQTSYTYASATDQGASSAVTQSSVNGGSISTSTTATSYAWYDGQAAASVTVSGPTGSATTSFAYDGAGRLVSASVGGVNPRDVRYTLDAQGQVIRRDESASGTGDGSSRPHQLWYRFGGREIGTVTNDGLNATDGANYPNSDAVRQTELGTGTFIDGQNLGYSTAQFGAAPNAINSYSQGSAAGSYTVRAGDTLSSIAGALWGDASLWYKLAQANGLAGDGGLTAGATLSIPAGVMRSANSAGTYRPYNAASVVGDLSPTTPQPQAAAQQHNGCGVFGAILLAVVAVAVAVLLPEVAGTYFGAGGALGGGVVDGVVTGAVAGAVSQGVGLATGIQNKFSWSGLALSAIGGGIGAALDGVNPLGIANNTAQAAVNAVLGNIALQGIGVVTGLQSKFDFAGVAAAGLGAGLASQVHLGGIGGAILRGGASDLANAAARSLINGTDFGDNVLAALPDAIGQTVGDAMAARFARRGGKTPAYAGGGDDAFSTTPAIGDTELPIAQINVSDLDLDLPTFDLGGGGGSLGRDAVPIGLGPTDANGDIVVTAPSHVVPGVGSIPTAHDGGDWATVFTSSTYMNSSFVPWAKMNYGGATGDDIYTGVMNNLGDPSLLGRSIIPNLQAAIAGHGAELPQFQAALDRLIQTSESLDAFADAEVNEVIRPVFQPLDLGLSLGAIGHGRAGLSDYFNVGMAVLPGVFKAGGMVARVGAGDALTGVALARRLGIEGEQAVGLTGSKVGVRTPGSTKLRFPDEVTTTTLTEVKNVGYQGFTSQLRDYAAYAQNENLTFQLYVRPSTKISTVLDAAIQRREIMLRYIPGAK